MKRCHAGHSTGGIGKERATLASALFTNPRWDRRTGLYVTLVGNGANLARHIGEARMHGYEPSSVSVYEIDPKTYESIRAEVGRLPYPISWCLGDVFMTRLRVGVIGHLDLDLIERMTEATLARTVSLVHFHQVQTFSLTLTARGSGECDAIGEPLGIPLERQSMTRSWKNKTGTVKKERLFHRDPKAVLKAYFKKALPNYEFECIGYAGGKLTRSPGGTPMVMLIGRMA